MRFLILGSVFCFACIGISSAWLLDNYNNNELDLDMLYFGGAIIPGNPKFKVSQHPDGYSIQVGVDRYFMRMRFSNIDNSIDFSILDYKGSLTYRVQNWTPNGPDLEGKLEFVGGISGRSGLPIDAVIKLKYKRIQSGQYASPLDPYDVELSFDNTYLNSGRYGRSGEIHIGGEYIKEPKYLNMAIKIMITPKNLAESTLSFNLGTEGKLITGINNEQEDEDDYDSYGGYRSSYRAPVRNSYYGRDYYTRSEGTFNMTASLMVIKVVEPTRGGGPNAPLPSVTMALDLETNRFIIDTEFEPSNGTGLDDSYSKQKHSWKKSILLEGMINPTGKGARLGVIKATDGNTGKSMGRIQARRKDDENLRFEVFSKGNEIGALNYHENPNGYTNITIEADKCGRSGSKYGPLKVYERTVGDTKMEQRWYRDLFQIERCTYDSEWLKGFTEGTEGLVYEEKLSVTNSIKYMYNLLLSDGREFKNVYLNLDNIYNNTKFQIGVMNKYKHYQSNELSIRNSDRLDFDITPNPRDRGERRLKFSHNQRPLFEGWFKGLEKLHRYATEIIPPRIDQAFLTMKDYHMNLGKVLKQYV